MHLKLIRNALVLFRWDTITHTAYIGELHNMLRMLRFFVLFHRHEYTCILTVELKECIYMPPRRPCTDVR
jgi:hypothetical protein